MVSKQQDLHDTIDRKAFSPIDAPEESNSAATDAETQNLSKTSDSPDESRMSRREYEERKFELQVELLKLRLGAEKASRKFAILFEGRDAAGKGGAIKRFAEHLNPRLSRVAALDRPSEVENGQWYFQRYVAHLPTSGEIVFYDRSWYNRAGVERVMGFCTAGEYLEFMRQTPIIEQMLVRSGIGLFKYWFSVSKEEQSRRFRARAANPLKKMMISSVDMAGQDKWSEYTQAKEEMFFHTHTADAPWTVIKSDDKKRARINCMLHFLNSVDYPDKDEKVVVPPDPHIVAPPPSQII